MTKKGENSLDFLLKTHKEITLQKNPEKPPEKVNKWKTNMLDSLILTKLTEIVYWLALNKWSFCSLGFLQSYHFYRFFFLFQFFFIFKFLFKKLEVLSKGLFSKG